MKKIILTLLIVALVLTTGFACLMYVNSEAPSENNITIVWEEDNIAAMAFLGYGEYLFALGTYTADTAPIPVYEIEGDEYYLLVPKDKDTQIKIYENDFNTMEKGKLLFDIETASPFVLKCNVSDIFSNVVIELVSPTKTIEFSPFLSLMDGSVVVPEDIQLLTPPIHE